ncbi:hypothetical protein V498_10504 [Pseudogymnoascus sp. VKM F-4517 (FW-2822)]|nr:hypothetical protein V498_10504 [Pseudogymnoascus sp. VKM F-4517 (FW-2822)]
MKLSHLAVLGGLFAESSLGAVVPHDVAADLHTSFIQNSCSMACIFLSAVLWGKVSMPDSTVYDAQQTSLWAVQSSESAPACRFTPTSALDVSVALLVLRSVKCQFAVRGAGHAPFTGANNIDGGLTIDLTSLDSITLTADKTELRAGGGAHWSQVYNYLESYDLTVIGGRASTVGVGGLTLGGGISFFSARYGWACDNVNNFQVVFADGSIHDVNRKTYPDLFQALKGGGNNFGIVTRFDLATYPQGDMWGGLVQYTEEKLEIFIDALSYFGDRQAEDPDCAAIVSFIYYQAYGINLVNLNLESAKPVVNPALLKNFTDVPSPLKTTMRLTTLSNITDEMAAGTPAGFREQFRTMTIKNSPSLMLELVALFKTEIAAIKAVKGVFPVISFQVISTATIGQFTKNGGNPLGITADDGTLILISTSNRWTNAADDAAMYAMADRFYAAAKATATAQGLLHPYVYMNYADGSQDVFTGYGAANKAKLLATAKKYDSFGVFRSLLPGGHKLK